MIPEESLNCSRRAIIDPAHNLNLQLVAKGMEVPGDTGTAGYPVV